MRVVVAVRAALPSPRPQGWQALQQAVGLAELGVDVVLVGDAGRPDGGPSTLESWLGRPLPSRLETRIPARPSRPPLAGLRFRLAMLRSSGDVLLCRDPRVAAAQAGRWPLVVMEWHIQPDLADARHRAALVGADLHVTPAPGLRDDLRAAGVAPLLLPNACGLDRDRALRRRATRDPSAPVLALGLHRRGGLDDALLAWSRHPDLPPLRIAGRDQGGARVDGWQRRIDTLGLTERVRLIGPAWGPDREELLDSSSAWLAPYPDDASTRTRLCPLQVVDALGSGLPLVAPALPSIEALGGGVLYEPADPDALAAAVRRAVGSEAPDPAARPRWADRARQLLDALPRRRAA